MIILSAYVVVSAHGSDRDWNRRRHRGSVPNTRVQSSSSL
jgi:hypothetical protein